MPAGEPSQVCSLDTTDHGSLDCWSSIKFDIFTKGILDFLQICDGYGPDTALGQLESSSQLSNLWWMPNSVCMGFDIAMRTGSSKRFKRYPTTYIWVSSQLPFTKDYDKLGWASIHSKGNPTGNSHIGCGESFESSWWARFHSSTKTHANWVWHLS